MDQERLVPLNKRAVELLRQSEATEGFVFCKENGEPFDEDYVSRVFKRAVRDGRFEERLHLHNLRATFASWLQDAGVPLAVIKELLGHTYLKTTEGYTRVHEKTLFDAVNKL